MNHKKHSGLSLIETIIVMAIIALLLIAFLVMLFDQLPKSRDAKRKSDLNLIQTAFEDYYNDNECYPPTGSLDNCGSEDLRPYLRNIPCDPMDEQPYQYQPAGNVCAGYRIYTRLENNDPIIDEIGCTGGCGGGLDASYNYGVSSGMAVSDGNVAEPTPSPSSSPSPSPTGPIYVYACDRTGECNKYIDGHPFLASCPMTWPTDTDCAAANCKGKGNEYLWCK